jgi:hypothetical protein
VFQNWRIPNSERGREGPSGIRKYLEKKLALPEEDISTWGIKEVLQKISWTKYIIYKYCSVRNEKRNNLLLKFIQKHDTKI